MDVKKPEIVPEVRKLNLTKLERLESKAKLSEIEFARERLSSAEASFLAQLGQRVVDRCGIKLKDGDRVELKYHRDGDGVSAIEIEAGPAPASPAELAR